MSNSTSSKEGCLTAILRLLGIGPKEREPDPEPFPYRVRDDFLSPAEVSFFRVLRSTLKGHATVCPKVRLGDIFFVSRPHENQSYLNRIARKHLDFLLCNPKTMRPIVGIELDDSSHQRSDRRARDEFIEQVFEAANLPLVRVQAQLSYNTNELSAQLAPFLGEAVAGPANLSRGVESAALAMDQHSPMCPKCGVPMVVRTVKRGQHAGKQFYGCRNFPKCREVLPLSASRR